MAYAAAFSAAPTRAHSDGTRGGRTKDGGISQGGKSDEDDVDDAEGLPAYMWERGVQNSAAHIRWRDEAVAGLLSRPPITSDYAAYLVGKRHKLPPIKENKCQHQCPNRTIHRQSTRLPIRRSIPFKTTVDQGTRS